MSTVSQRIRAAALGPVPGCPGMLSSWIHSGKEVEDMRRRRDDFRRASFFAWQNVRRQPRGMLFGLTNSERRMFLLFVAEALE